MVRSSYSQIQQCLANVREIELPIVKVKHRQLVPGYSPARMSVGYFLDPFVAILRHNCVPNCVVTFEGNQVRVRAIRDIRPGEELTLYFGQNIGRDRSDYNSRRAFLKSHLNIDCTCKLCTQGPIGPTGTLHAEVTRLLRTLNLLPLREKRDISSQNPKGNHKNDRRGS